MTQTISMNILSSQTQTQRQKALLIRWNPLWSILQRELGLEKEQYFAEH